jgi:tRNA pseudouridine synthase 10
MKNSKPPGRKQEGLFRKLLGKKELSLARRLAQTRLCDNCLGRQFAQLSTGLTNRRRGEMVREELDKKPASGCRVCNGFFGNLERWADEAAEKLECYEYGTFAVGTRAGHAITRAEESLWEEAGIEHCEPFRSESNREFGKVLEKRIGKEVDEKNPDMLVLLDLDKNEIQLSIRSVYVYGLYKKMVRGIPQTKWDKYPVTVEDIIAKPFMEVLEGKGHSLHCAGREDIDALCLVGRPFVLEIESPKKRKLDLKSMEKLVNRGGKVEIEGIRPSSRQEVIEVKSMRPDKKYRLLVEFEKAPTAKGIESLKSLVGPINQQTPTRVMHRRADLLRKKKVKSIECRKVTKTRYEIFIRGDAGLYAKEFVHGDAGRTKPSVAEKLGIAAKVLELDVVKIYL